VIRLTGNNKFNIEEKKYIKIYNSAINLPFFFLKKNINIELYNTLSSSFLLTISNITVRKKLLLGSEMLSRTFNYLVNVCIKNNKKELRRIN